MLIFVFKGKIKISNFYHVASFNTFDILKQYIINFTAVYWNSIIDISQWLNNTKVYFNSLLASGNFCRLPLTFETV